MHEAKKKAPEPEEKKEEEKEAAPAVEAFNPEERRAGTSGEWSEASSFKGCSGPGQFPWRKRGAAKAAAHGPVTALRRGKSQADPSEVASVGCGPGQVAKKDQDEDAEEKSQDATRRFPPRSCVVGVLHLDAEDGDSDSGSEKSQKSKGEGGNEAIDASLAEFIVHFASPCWKEKDAKKSEDESMSEDEAPPPPPEPPQPPPQQPEKAPQPSEPKDPTPAQPQKGPAPSPSTPTGTPAGTPAGNPAGTPKAGQRG